MASNNTQHPKRRSALDVTGIPLDRLSWSPMGPVTREDLTRPDIVSDRTLKALNQALRGRFIVYLDGRKIAIVDRVVINQLKKLCVGTTKRAVNQ